jgi:hypothetical protein
MNIGRAIVALLPLAIAFASSIARAEDVPQSFTLDGRLFGDAAGSAPLVDSTIGFKIQILDEDQLCVLYEERQTLNTLSSKGYFSVQVGSKISDPRRSIGDSGKGTKQHLDREQNIDQQSESLIESHT